jgi:uridine phosphorylase
VAPLSITSCTIPIQAESLSCDMPLGESELILNPDNSIYHLNLCPEDLAETVITVGDPERVAKVSNYFDHIELRKGKREFITHTGVLNRKRISVVSTGIGTDNIDIVLNELDALASIDFGKRTLKARRKQLTIVRLGTTGAVQPDIPPDSFLLSDMAIGFDGLLHHYRHPGSWFPDIEAAFIQQTNWPDRKARPYVVNADPELAKQFSSHITTRGFTATYPGFYGPQGRSLRLEADNPELLKVLSTFNFNGLKITNLEMETSGIYALAKLLGHSAVSMNCVLANRATTTFSGNPEKAIDSLIRFVLEKLCGGPAV